MENEKYHLTVGLEIHAELKTRTKMFCDSKNDPDETRPNVNVCPVCMGHPGTLPVINKEAVKHVLKVGVALGGTLADETRFDRKNYFYPDIPKGYQISQYQYPLVSGGSLNGIAITRVHLEEDTGTSQHLTINNLPLTADSESKVKGPAYAEASAGRQRSNVSLIDFNRAGIPLMELVTEPVIYTPKEAGDFARELQLLLRYLGASDANMEKGEMRVEANISVKHIPPSASRSAPLKGRIDNSPLEDGVSRRETGDVLGTKVEVKNLNSFRSVERAIEYEMKRQSELLTRGEPIAQETRGWDEAKQQTFSQRRKEESHDYRYFPEPDLPTLSLSLVPEFSVTELKKTLPELPSEKRARYLKEGVKKSSAEMFVADARYGILFEKTIACMKTKTSNKSVEMSVLIANYISTDIAGLVSKYGDGGLQNITPKDLAYVVCTYFEKRISSRGVKDAIAEVFEKGGNLSEVCKKYFQHSNEEELKKCVERIIAENKKVVADYKAGKESALQFLVGQCMKITRGAGNPQVLHELLIKEMLRG